MIKGFDVQTKPLTEYEEACLLPVVIAWLKTKRGAGSAVTNNYIVSKLKTRYKVNEPRIRKVINHIRTNDLLPGLIATKNGYYLATSEEEMNDYVDSLRGREDAIRAVRMAMERQRKQLYGKKTEIQGKLIFSDL